MPFLLGCTISMMELFFHPGVHYAPDLFSTRMLPSPDSIALVRTAGEFGQTGLEISLLARESVLNGRRSELVDSFEPVLGKKYSYSLEFFLPAGGEEADNPIVLSQWHTREAYKPPVAIRLREDSLDVTLDHLRTDTPDPDLSGQIRWISAPLPARGRWHSYRLDAVWSPNASGYLAFWLDGELLGIYHGPTTYADQAIGPYFKFGIYTSRPAQVSKRIVFGDYSRGHCP